MTPSGARALGQASVRSAREPARADSERSLSLRMSMRTLPKAALLASLLAATAAAAQQVGEGSGKSSVTPPPTKDSGSRGEGAEMPISTPAIEPRHGLLGAPGAALDSAGPSRLGPPPDRISIVAEMPDSWRSGDRVRSLSSSDVRAARRQQAPDLEWAPAQRASPAHGGPTAGHESRAAGGDKEVGGGGGRTEGGKQ